MKRKVFSTLLVLVLTLSLGLATALPVSAAPVTQTVTGDGAWGFTLAEMDQQFSAETIDASAGDTVLTGSVTLGNFEASDSFNDVWYEIGLVSEATYLDRFWLQNKGVYMIAFWDEWDDGAGEYEYYKVHIQNVPCFDPAVTGNYLGDEVGYVDVWGVPDDAGSAWFKVPSAAFDYELKYHDVTVSDGKVDLRISVDGGTNWSGWKLYKYAEDDAWTLPLGKPAKTEQAAADYGCAGDDDLTNARIVSQIFVCSGTEETFTAEYDNIQVNGAPYALSPRVVNTDTHKGYTAIQLAVDAAGPGETISVAAGTYAEAVFIDKGLTLNGAKVGVDARTRDTVSGESIVDGAGLDLAAGVGAFNIADGVSNVMIDGFEICNWPASANPGNGSAVMAYSFGAATQGLSQVIIQNNYMHDLGWNGVLVWSNNAVVQDDFTIQFNLIEEAPYAAIELTNVTNSAVLGNKIVAPTVIANDPGDAGVGIEVAARAQLGITMSVGNVLVEGNEITGTFAEDSRAAINILSRAYSSTSNATLTGVIVKDNAVSASVEVSILAVAESRDGGPATISNLQIVDGNTVSGFGKAGVVAKDVDSVQVEGNVISATDHSLAPNGIQVGYIDAEFNLDPTATTGTVKGNQVSGCSWEGYDPLTETYEDDWTGSGILVIAPNSALEISGNEVQSCDVAMDIEAGSGTLITSNDVHGNSYGFVLWNADPTISQNSICQNALGGVYRTIQVEQVGILDAENNWWGHSSGPGGEGRGSGDTVSTNVDFKPWLLSEGGTPVGVYDEYMSLPDGWSLISPDRAWSDWEAMGAELMLAYGYNPQEDTMAFGTPEQGSFLSPLAALYVKTNGGGQMGISYPENDLGMYATDLEAGWNLIGIPETDATTVAILSHLRFGGNNEAALATLVSQGNYNQNSDSFYLATLSLADWGGEGIPNGDGPGLGGVTLNPFDGYWAYMNVAKEFGVVVVVGGPQNGTPN